MIERKVKINPEELGSPIIVEDFTITKYNNKNNKSYLVILHNSGKKWKYILEKGFLYLSNEGKIRCFFKSSKYAEWLCNNYISNIHRRNPSKFLEWLVKDNSDVLFRDLHSDYDLYTDGIIDKKDNLINATWIAVFRIVSPNSYGVGSIFSLKKYMKNLNLTVKTLININDIGEMKVMKLK